MSTPLALSLSVLLLAVNGGFVAAEFAVLAARRSRLEQMSADGDRRAEAGIKASQELSLMLAGAQLGITMCSLGLGALAEPAVAGLIESALHDAVKLPDGVTHAIGFSLGLSIVVFLHMVLGEMAPKSVAISAPERSVLWLARPFVAFVKAFRPLIEFLNWVANGVVRLTGTTPRDSAAAHSAADLGVLIRQSGAGSGGTPGIDPTDQELLTRGLHLNVTTVESVMTPAADIVHVDVDDTAADIEATATATDRSRLVVTRDGDPDAVAGMVLVRDLLLLDDAERAERTAAEMVRPISLLSPDQAVEDVLVSMQGDRRHLGLVVGDGGETLGLVTLRDLIEEVVGDVEEPPVRLRVQGRLKSLRHNTRRRTPTVPTAGIR
ncbi:MAG: hemolysin family protein [Microthrixaceae bacterium]